MEPLKLMFSPDLVAKLNRGLAATYQEVDLTPLVFTTEWVNLELNERVNHIASVLYELWPKDFERAHVHLLDLADWFFKEKDHIQGYVYMFLPNYVQRFGLADPDLALSVIERLTVLVSCEFAIRPLLIQHQDLVMQKMLDWAKYPNHSVRRLASEGCRPRLPWGLALQSFINNPDPIFPILDALANDDSLYVRKSVANNLNDICKSHPEKAIAWAVKHKGQADWVINHGLRTLLKRGDQNALQLLGWNEVKISNTVIHLVNPIKLGETATFNIEFELEMDADQLRLEYKIDYYRPTKSSPKVFMLGKQTLKAGKHQRQISISFKDLSTRKHYAGPHQLSFIANGVVLQTIGFEVE
jgi:3-methyladenine DNA glycosylase AlkC